MLSPFSLIVIASHVILYLVLCLVGMYLVTASRCMLTVFLFVIRIIFSDVF